ncbi:MAG: conjugal transfer protein TrbI [Rhodospirillaceae bacterium]|nr:conjugal transfer protein TrbI [Rhodospirillaceae bacterium]
MTENPQGPLPKDDPETLVLRGSPRRVTRFKRNLLIGAAAVACVAVFAMLGLGLKMPGPRAQTGKQELYNVDRKTTAEGLAGLPGNYGEVKAAEPPKLGPPLPGDLGPPILAQERSLGLDGEGGFEQNAEENDARAERIRLAQQARRAKEASVFFQLSQSRGTAPAPSDQRWQGGGGAAGAMDPSPPALNAEDDQNNQQRKIDFLSKPGERSIYNAYPLQDAVSPFQVMAGSVIAASLITGINSDLPGLVTAQVTENVYDTVSGKFLLIPQGARLIGSYDSVVAFGQSRALLVWKRIVMPDGSSVQIENLPATDPSGYAGLADKVDFHTWRLLKGVALSTLLGVGTELSLGSDESDLVRAIRESTQQNVNRAGQRITEKNLNIQPTITVRPGWPLRVIVHSDLILRPYKG